MQGLALLLYLLGLSYGAVLLILWNICSTGLTLGALGLYLSKSRVYDVVQAVAERVPGLKREAVFGGIRTPAMGGDATSVKCGGNGCPLG